MKKLFCLVFLLLFFVSACDSHAIPTSSDLPPTVHTEAAPESSSTVPTTLNDIPTEADSTEESSSETEYVAPTKSKHDFDLELELDYLSNYLSLEQYRISGFTLSGGPELSKTVDEVLISGQRIIIGMGYDQLLSKGFTPTDEDFKNTPTKTLAYLCDFTDSSGKVVRIGFIGKSGSTVENGSLYSISVKTNDDYCDFEGDGFNRNSSISDIIASYGEPTYIRCGNYSDFLDASFDYYFEDRSVYLTFSFNLETGALHYVCLEGYAE